MQLCNRAEGPKQGCGIGDGMVMNATTLKWVGTWEKQIMNFAEKLYYLRTENGYSQETLAGLLNVSRQAISKWELGTTLPETDKIIAIGELFGVSLDSLLVDSVPLNTKENLDRLVLKFLSSARDMDNISKELVDIMKDGIIDNEEKVQLDEIIKTLDAVTKIISEIKHKMNLQ